MSDKEEILNILSASDKIKAEFNKDVLLNLLKEIDGKNKKNLSLREKNKLDYKKYLPIEESLNEDVVVLQRLAAYPALIPDFLSAHGVETTLSLLSHPNSDLVNNVVNLIEEITEGNFLNDIEEPQSYLELFLSNNLFSLLLDNLIKLSSDENDKEDTNQYEIDILTVIENYIDVYSPSCELLCKTTTIIEWLVDRIKSTSVALDSDDDIKLFCSEILNELLQNSEVARETFTKKELMPKIINVLIMIKENQGKGGTNEEYLSNVVNCICAAMLKETNRALFNKSGGFEMVVDFLKEKGNIRLKGMKILNFAVSNDKQNCNFFIECNGLSVLFSFFMKKGFKNSSESLAQISSEYNVYCLEVIINLLRFAKENNKVRLLWKFKEKKKEKLKFLVGHYLNPVISEESKDNIYYLQMCSVLLLGVNKELGIDKKSIKELNVDLSKVHGIVEEFFRSIGGDEEKSEDKESLRGYIKSIL